MKINCRYGDQRFEIEFPFAPIVGDVFYKDEKIYEVANRQLHPDINDPRVPNVTIFLIDK
jgi:hypothetical protein